MMTDDGYELLYAHLSKVLVKEGDIVERGQIIAETGSTGWSTGPHLHISIWKDSVLLDPLPLFDYETTQETKNEYVSRGEVPPSK